MRETNRSSEPPHKLRGRAFGLLLPLALLLVATTLLPAAELGPANASRRIERLFVSEVANDATTVPSYAQAEDEAFLARAWLDVVGFHWLAPSVRRRFVEADLRLAACASENSSAIGRPLKVLCSPTTCPT